MPTPGSTSPQLLWPSRRGCVVRPLALELGGAVPGTLFRECQLALPCGCGGRVSGGCRWAAPGSQSSCAGEGNAESGAEAEHPTSTASAHPTMARPQNRPLPPALLLLLPLLLRAGGHQAAPAGRGWGLVVTVVGCWHQSPKRSQTPHCCLVPGVRPPAWRTGGGSLGCQEGPFTSPSVHELFRLSVNCVGTGHLLFLPVLPLFPLLMCSLYSHGTSCSQATTKTAFLQAGEVRSRTPFCSWAYELPPVCRVWKAGHWF